MGLGLSSWSELAPDRDALCGDGWYTLCVVIAFGFLGVYLLRPQRLDVDVTLARPVNAGGVIEAAAVPLNVRRADGRISSRQREDSCPLATGACRLTFD